jgi:hypothetical protein
VGQFALLNVFLSAFAIESENFAQLSQRSLLATAHRRENNKEKGNFFVNISLLNLEYHSTKKRQVSVLISS